MRILKEFQIKSLKLRLCAHSLSLFSKGFSLLRGRTGFTLIELLVVFSIISVLSGIGIAAFASYSRSQQLNQAANNVKLLVAEARFNSLSAVKTNKNPSGDTVTCGAETLIGYSITVLGNNQLEMKLLCVNLSTATVKLMTMPKGYTFAPATTCSEITFASLTATAAGLPCQIVLSGIGQTKTISIDAVGNTSIL